jgi:hypothetical protein
MCVTRTPDRYSHLVPTIPMARQETVVSVNGQPNSDLARSAHAQALTCDSEGKAAARGAFLSVTNHGGDLLCFGFGRATMKPFSVPLGSRVVVPVPEPYRSQQLDTGTVVISVLSFAAVSGAQPAIDELDSLPLDTPLPERQSSVTSLPPHNADLEDDMDCCLGLCGPPGWSLYEWLPASAPKLAIKWSRPASNPISAHPTVSKELYTQHKDTDEDGAPPHDDSGHSSSDQEQLLGEHQRYPAQQHPSGHHPDHGKGIEGR